MSVVDVWNEDYQVTGELVVRIHNALSMALSRGVKHDQIWPTEPHHPISSSAPGSEQIHTRHGIHPEHRSSPHPQTPSPSSLPPPSIQLCPASVATMRSIATALVR